MKKKVCTGGSEMATGIQKQTAWAPWIRDLAEMLETCLTEVKHKGELKLRHPESLACGRLLHTTIHWKNRWATCPLTHQLPAPKVLGRPSADQTEYIRAWAAHGKKKKTKKKKQNSKTLNPQPVKSFSSLQYTEKIVGLQHLQTLAANLPRWCRQTGLDAKGIMPELLRLNFYCSSTGIFFSSFL
jgi:hypothetical protein